jgi:hypothetical protein
MLAVITFTGVVVAAPSVLADGPFDVDAGDTIDRAMDLEAGFWDGNLTRNMTMNDTADFFEFGFSGGHDVEASLVLMPDSTTHSNVRFHVFDRSKAEVVNFTFTGIGIAQRFAALTNEEFPTLYYYFAVTWTGSPETPYVIFYNLSLAEGEKQNDAGTGGDVSALPSRAESLAIGGMIQCRVGGTHPQWNPDLNIDGGDAYEVMPRSNEFLVAKVTLDSMSDKRGFGFDIRLEDQSSKLLGLEDVLLVGETGEIRYFSDVALPVYLVIVSESEWCNYTLSIDSEPPPEIDLFVGSITVTPPKPAFGHPATITIVFRSSTQAVPSVPIRYSVETEGGLIEDGNLLFDERDNVSLDISWEPQAGKFSLLASIDTLNAIPYELNESNNQLSLSVTVGVDGDGDDGDGDDEGLADWVWLVIIIIVILVVIAAATAMGFRSMRGRGGEPEEPEDY